LTATRQGRFGPQLGGTVGGGGLRLGRLGRGQLAVYQAQGGQQGAVVVRFARIGAGDIALVRSSRGGLGRVLGLAGLGIAQMGEEQGSEVGGNAAPVLLLVTAAVVFRSLGRGIAGGGFEVIALAPDRVAVSRGGNGGGGGGFTGRGNGIEQGRSGIGDSGAGHGGILQRLCLDHSQQASCQL